MTNELDQLLRTLIHQESSVSYRSSKTTLSTASNYDSSIFSFSPITQHFRGHQSGIVVNGHNYSTLMVPCPGVSRYSRRYLITYQRRVFGKAMSTLFWARNAVG